MNVYVLPQPKTNCPWVQLPSLEMYPIIEAESSNVKEMWSYRSS